MQDQPAPTPAGEVPQLRLRIVFDGGHHFGPGKAALLEGIARTGSIAAAGRAMGMSYKRAWDLTQEMNAMFTPPLVAQSRGGAGGGGASLTQQGRAVLAHYRALERAALDAGADDLAAICAARAVMGAQT